MRADVPAARYGRGSLRVAAARTLLAEDEKKAPAQGMAQIPGFSFLVIDARSPMGQPLPNGHSHPMIDVRPVAAPQARIR
jgi:hypothetical protein